MSQFSKLFGSFKAIVAGASLVVCSSVALAQTPPAGALADLGALAGFGTPTPSTTTNESFSFTAANANTTVSFAFREVPAYFAFSNVSVVANGGSTNLITNPNFQGSALHSVVPNGWGRWIQPIDVSAIGQVSSAASPYGCGNIVPNQALFWCDGSVQGFDAIYQTIATTIGSTYTISFNLADNGGTWRQANTSGSGIDMLVYALNGVNTTPVGTTSDCPTCGIPNSVPEPISPALVGIALILLACSRRLRVWNR